MGGRLYSIYTPADFSEDFGFMAQLLGITIIFALLIILLICLILFTDCEGEGFVGNIDRFFRTLFG